MMNQSFTHGDENDNKKKKKKVTVTTTNTDFGCSGVYFDIHEDLIMEFLVRLPPISLLRFKSVSKRWYSLISNPNFLRRNTVHQLFLRGRRNINQWHVDLLEDWSSRRSDNYVGDPMMLIIPPKDDHECVDYNQVSRLPLLLRKVLVHYCPPTTSTKHEHISLLDSCNGLLLYVVSDIGVLWNKCTWYVCNPITQDYIKLPTIAKEERELKTAVYLPAKIVFDSLVSLTYKIVLWIKYKRRPPYNNMPVYQYQLYVYSSETRSWKLSVSRTNYSVFGHFGYYVKGVLCNGVLYWTTMGGSIDSSVCYDVKKEIVGVLKYPKIPMGYLLRELFYFGECGGRLRLIEKYHKRAENINGFPLSFNILEMKQQLQKDVQSYGNEEDELWIRIHRVDLEEGDPYYRIIRFHAMFHAHIMHYYKSRRMEKDDEEVLLISRFGNKIVLFNPASDTFEKELQNGRKMLTTNGFLLFTDVLNYTITLFPPSL